MLFQGSKGWGILASGVSCTGSCIASLPLALSHSELSPEGSLAESELRCVLFLFFCQHSYAFLSWDDFLPNRAVCAVSSFL